MSTADRIAETLQRLGDIQAQGVMNAANARAQAQANSAQIWGGALSQLSQIPGQIVSGIQQAKTTGLENQQRQMQLQSLKDAQIGQQRANAVVAGLPKNQDGTYDPSSLVQKLASANVPLAQQEALVKSIDGVNGVISGFNKSRTDHAADLANAILSQKTAGQPVTADAVHLGMAAAVNTGLASQSEADQLTQALASGADPEALLKQIRSMGSKYKPDYQALPGDSPGALDKTTGDIKLTGIPKTFKDKTQLLFDAADPNSPTQQQSIAALKLEAESQPNKSPTETTLAIDAADPNSPTRARSAAALRLLKPAGAGGLTPDAAAARGDAKTVAQGIKQFVDTGEGLSPEILLSARTTAQGMALNAELQRMGVDTGKLTREWTATKGAIRSLNSNQQIRLAEVINKASESLDKLDELNTEWSTNATRWGVKALNRASLAAAQNGAFGPEAASVATRLQAQIADVTSELGQGVMGGNAPTDHALKLAAKNLSADWTQKVLSDSIKQARYNLNLAQNARNELLNQVGVQSTQFQTPPVGAGATAPPPAAGATPPPGARILVWNPKTGKLE